VNRSVCRSEAEGVSGPQWRTLGAIMASTGRETVRRWLHEKALKPWQKKMWCIPAVDAEFVARTEDVLDLYAATPPRTRPVVYFDETPTQLIGEKRAPRPPAPGQPERYDYECRRNGTANLFVFVDAHRPWRHVKVTEQRTAREFAACMRDLVEKMGRVYPKWGQLAVEAA
jgi:hypothetical protein